MFHLKTLIIFICSAALICISPWITSAYAITIKEEKELAREFLKVVKRHYEIIDDPMIKGYVDRVGRKLAALVPSQPFEYHFYIINEPTYNAFAIPAGHIFIYSGLLQAMQNEEELAGILSHEIAHVACRHISKQIERRKKINIAALAGVLAGTLIAAGGGDASALIIGSVAGSQSLNLAYSREDETQADQLGLNYLTQAGYSGRGLLRILKEIRNREWFGSKQVPTYLRTHPALEERIVYIGTWLERQKTKHNKTKIAPTNPSFRKVNLRLKALYGDPQNAIHYFQNALAQNPSDTDLSYGYGLILGRTGNRAQAIKHIKAAMTRNALDPLILSDLGRVYFLDGRYQNALDTLQGALSLAPSNAQALFYIGRTRMELSEFSAAAEKFETLLAANPDHKQAHYFLGETYGKLKKMGPAHYHLGVFYYRKGELRNARFHLTRAAQDINDLGKQQAIDGMLKSIIREIKKKKNK